MTMTMMMVEGAAGAAAADECEKSLLEYVRKSTPPPFLLKTYMLVEDPATDEIISWNEEGTAFVVWQPAEFARDLLPTLFKHSNFSSFVRQLNTYGFRKVATSRWEFSNDMFGKGKKDLLCEIRRRKAWTSKQQNKSHHHHHHHHAADHDHQDNNNGADHHHHHHHSDEDQSTGQQRSSSTSSSSQHQEYTVLVDENKRLKKENGFLSSELSTMKKKCNDLLDLVTLYSNTTGDGDRNALKHRRPIADHDNDDDEVDDDRRPIKLFGVRLEVHGGGGGGGEMVGRKRKFVREKVCENAASSTVFLFQSCNI